MTLSSPVRPDAGVVPRRFDARCAIGLACLLTALAPVPVSAVGIGAITQQSALGQSLRVVVPLTLGEGEAVASECFRIAAAQQDADGIPQLLFGRVNVERSSAGTTLVITNPRPVNDPVVRLTIQAGCESAACAANTRCSWICRRSRSPSLSPKPRRARPPSRHDRRPPLANRGAESGPRCAPPRAQPRQRERERAPRPPARPRHRKAAPPRKRRRNARQRWLPTSRDFRCPAAPLVPRPDGVPTTADREKAQQEQAAAIETETQVLRQRIVELTALVERMQQEVHAQEIAERPAAEAAKATPQQSATPTPSEPAKTAPEPATAAFEPAKAAPEPATAALEPAKTATAKAQKTSPPVPARDWWDDNAALIAAIVLLPLLIAAGLLWKRRRGAAEDDQWRPGRSAAPRADRAPQAPQSVLRNPTAGLVTPRSESTSTISGKESDRGPPDDLAVDALAVSELSHVTEEARVFAALGHNDRAIEVLHEHIRRLPRSMPAAWLMLLDLYHATGNRPEFRRRAEDFHVHFNVQTPLWEAFVRRARARRARWFSARRGNGRGALAKAGMPRLSGAPALRQSGRSQERISVVDLRRHPVAGAGPRRAGGRRHRQGSRQRRQAGFRSRGAFSSARSAVRNRCTSAHAKADAARPRGLRPAQQPIRFDIEPPVTKSKPKA